MQIKLYQVDAFADALFQGNPAAVCPLPEWLPDEILQAIALENNLSETAFLVLDEDPMRLRWFTPTVEVELCGHATLATAHVLSQHLELPQNSFTFTSLGGPLSVHVERPGTYTLDFPRDHLKPVSPDHPYLVSFNQRVLEAWRGSTDYLLRLESQKSVEELKVNYAALKDADGRGFIVTAEGDSCDYVARCFYPQAGIDEDPATGSSQTTLAPFWADRLGKQHFTAQQLSARGASFATRCHDDRVLITGNVVSYLEGVITI